MGDIYIYSFAEYFGWIILFDKNTPKQAFLSSTTAWAN